MIDPVVKEPVAVKFISKDSGKEMFEIGRTLDLILEQTGGRSLGSLKFSKWEQVDLDSVRDHPRFERAYEAVNDPKGRGVYFRGTYKQ